MTAKFPHRSWPTQEHARSSASVSPQSLSSRVVRNAGGRGFGRKLCMAGSWLIIAALILEVAIRCIVGVHTCEVEKLDQCPKEIVR